MGWEHWRFIIRLRLRSLFRRDRVEQELDEEMRFHLERQAAENVARGLSLGDAGHSAMQAFGGVEQLKEECRDMRRMNFIDHFSQDVRFALRSLRKTPSFTVPAVLIIALGIGAATAVFSLLNSVLLRPLPYRDPDQIVVLSTLWTRTGEHGQVSTPDYLDWHDESTSFAGMAEYSAGETPITAGAEAEFAKTAAVSNEFFKVFGVEPIGGRTFLGNEAKPSVGGSVVVSRSFWQDHYGPLPFVGGNSIQIAGRSLSVVGILPATFHFPEGTDVWFAANTIFPESLFRSAHNVHVIGRLKSNLTVKQAQTEMTLIGNRLAQKYPRSNTDKNVAVTLLRDETVKDVRLTLCLMQGAVGLVLLIACGNVANLLLAKATARVREMAVRAALGASRQRILRQLITEHLILALLACGAGLFIAYVGLPALIRLAPGNVPSLSDTVIDSRVLEFALAASVVACLIFGLAPATSAVRLNVNDALKQSAARSLGGDHSRLRGSLVIAEVALSVVLLTSAGLLIRSFAGLQSVNLGFHPENVLVMETSIPSSGPAMARRATLIYKRLLSNIELMPGVSSTGASRVPPGSVRSTGTYIIDRTPTPAEMGIAGPSAIFSVVAPGTFSTLGIEVKLGRDFTAHDSFEAPLVAVINESLAKQAFPGTDPLGHTIVSGLDTLMPMTIVGVAGDIRQRGPANKPEPEIYMPFEQHPGASTSLRILVRTSVSPDSVIESLRRRAQEIAPDMPVRFTTMETRLAENIAAPKFRTLLLTTFAMVAVCLAMAGIYGVVSYVVAQRTSEIGLRVALGAGPADVMMMVFSEGARLASIGLVLGGLVTVAGIPVLKSMLFGVKPIDPLTFGGMAGLVLLVTVAACYIPARRAAKVDPLAALRQE